MKYLSPSMYFISYFVCIGYYPTKTAATLVKKVVDSWILDQICKLIKFVNSRKAHEQIPEEKNSRQPVKKFE